MRIRQIVFAACDLARAAASLARLLQLDPPFRDPAVGEFGLDNAVFVFGDQFVEIVSPVRAGTTAGRLLDRRGDSGYMLILQSEDFDADRARVQALGVRTVWNVALPDIRAMHLHPKDIGGAIVSIDQPKPKAAWRWGGPGWCVRSGRRGLQRVRGVTVDAADPHAMARRWSQVLGRAAPEHTRGRYRLALEDGWVDFAAASARGEGIGGYTLAVADRPAVLAVAQAEGLAVDGDTVDVFGTRVQLCDL